MQINQHLSKQQLNDGIYDKQIRYLVIHAAVWNARETPSVTGLTSKIAYMIDSYKSDAFGPHLKNVPFLNIKNHSPFI